jgi:hypothetical protein
MMTTLPDFLMIGVGLEMSLEQPKMPDLGWTYLFPHFRLRVGERGLQLSQWALACGPGMGDVRLCVI